MARYKKLLAEATSLGQLDIMVRRNDVSDTQLRERRTGVPEKAVSWIEQGDFEWGYCRRTKVRKAPRAHYDHITKKVVLNMDHYCPWMFNVVGYMNYRFFVTFLLYVFAACTYGLFLTGSPFIDYAREDQRAGRPFELGDIEPGFTQRSAVMYTFVLALTIGFAVGLLLFWHIYLVLTAQTTIEFYGNQTKSYRARLRGLRYRNPYDLGSARRNWEQVFGKMNLLLSVLPSARKPPLPPWPKPGTTPIAAEMHIV
jgi:hypothetical protein